MSDEAQSARFKPLERAKALPDHVESMIADDYLVDRSEASCRVFRIYRGVPAHYHEQCDEYLYVLSGRGTFWMESPDTEAPFEPGDLLYFKKGVVHATPQITEEPVTFLSIDAPRRDPKDITFVDADSGDASDFMDRNT